MTVEQSLLSLSWSKSNFYLLVLLIHRNAVIRAGRKERQDKPVEVKAMSETAVTTEKKCFLQFALNVKKKLRCLLNPFQLSLCTAECAITKLEKTGNLEYILIKQGE
jgi:hypothetical protein